MKNMFCKKLKFLFYGLITLSSSWIEAASPVGFVNSLKGTVFSTLGGKTKILRPGDPIENLSDVFTEEGGKLEFADYFDNRYSLAGSGHIQLKDKTLLLKRGYLWMKSPQERPGFVIQTANALASYKKGEIIISFDEQERKTQLLTLQGRFRFGSIIEKIMSVDVEEGHFSFIKKDYNNEWPRTPVPIGEKSFKKVTALFDRFSSPEFTNIKRSIASTSSNNDKKSYFDTKDKKMRMQLLSNYQRKIDKTNKKSGVPVERAEGTEIIVNIFGRDLQRHSIEKTTSRMPASLPVPSPPSTDSSKNDPFESALMNQYKKQMRHESEVNSLIDTLKSYKSNYSKSH